MLFSYFVDKFKNSLNFWMIKLKSFYSSLSQNRQIEKVFFHKKPKLQQLQWSFIHKVTHSILINKSAKFKPIFKHHFIFMIINLSISIKNSTLIRKYILLHICSIFKHFLMKCHIFCLKFWFLYVNFNFWLTLNG